MKVRRVKESIRKLGKKSDGRITEFSFYAPEATEVYLAGEFNNWDTHALPMKKNRDGTWKKRIKLSSGCHEYKLMMDGFWVQDIPEANSVPNPFGTLNNIIVVK
jgi:1,4-alpha-glucan branching enzyme